MSRFKTNVPTETFWNCLGIAIVILSVSIFRGTNFRLESANQKLEVNRAVNRVRQVVTDIENKSELLPVTEEERIRLRTAQEELEATQQEILTDEADPKTREGEI